MSLRKVNFVSDEYYHIYNRGNSKQKIFLDTEDYLRFIALLFISNTNQKFDFYNLNRDTNFNIYELEITNQYVSIGSYCLMPNHFHILIKEKVEGGVSNFMQKLSTAYAMYYNKKYKRTGSLFEGKFKSKHIDTDVYFKYLFSYIHLNPIKLIQKDWKENGIKNKKEAIEYLNKYQYSSFLDFIGENRPQKQILDTKAFPEYFPDEKSFIKEIFEWLSYKEK
jgi:putative transposase